MQVTIFKNVFEKEDPHHIPLKTALQRIQTGKSSTTIDEVRSGNKDKKKRLPVVCFSGEFSSRADDALFEHSGYIVLDFDHVDVEATKRSLPRMILYTRVGRRLVERESRLLSRLQTLKDTAITSVPSSSTSREHMD